MSVLDLVLGPLTDTIARVRHRWRTTDGDYVSVSPLGQLVLTLARDEIGNGEEGGNNRGPHVRRWGRGREDIAHCSAFISYLVEEAAKTLSVPAGLDELFDDPRWHRRWRFVAKRTWSELGRIGHHVESPLPGDLVLFERGRDGDWQGHIEIVDRIELNSDRFTDIAANLGPYPALAKRVPRRLGRDRMIGLIRLP